MMRLDPRWLAGFALVAAAFFILVPSIPQDETFHLFADKRAIAGVPNFWNVVSNLPFAVIGIMALSKLHSLTDRVLFSALQNGIALGVLQCALALSLTGKLVYERATRPRVWVKATRRDPELPIRGRYLALRLAPEPNTAYFGTLDRQEVVYFVPGHLTRLEDLTVRGESPEIWAEVTIPRKGPPRPIRLGMKQSGRSEPVEVH